MKIKELLCNTSNHGGTRNTSTIKYIVIHYTGNKNDKAISNCKYFQSPNRNASAHYFVDENEVYQSVKDNIVAWSVGGNKYPNCNTTGGGKYYGKCTNNNSISIEMCNSVDKVPPEVRDNVKLLVGELMSKYNIPEENVIRHFDVVGKSCPACLTKQSEWDDFKKYILQDDKPGYIITKVKVNLFGTAVTVDTININDTNHVKLRDLECDKIKVGWNGKDVLVNNSVLKFTGILHNDTNYIKVRDLEQIGIKVEWDSKTNTIIIG